MGGGGLYSTAGDYLKFVRMMLNQGKSDGGEAVLKPATVAEMSKNAMGNSKVCMLKTAAPPYSNDAEFFPGMDKQWGLSFMINNEEAPTGRSPGSLAWAGLANTYYWIDQKKGVGGVYITQILPFVDVKSLPLFFAFEVGGVREVIRTHARPNSSVSSRTPRRRWRPSETRRERQDVAASANCCEIRRLCPSGSHNFSMRDASFTAGPITVKSSRAAVPTLPYCTVPRCSEISSSVACRPSARRRSFSASIRASASVAASSAALQASARVAGAGGEGREQAVAHEFQHLAAALHDRRHHAFEALVEQGDQLLAGRDIGQRGEAAQVGEEHDGVDALHLAALHRAGEDAARRIVAEIGGQQPLADRAQGDGLGGEGEQRQRLLQHRPCPSRDSRPAGRS